MGGGWPSVTSGLAAIVPGIPGPMSRGPNPARLDSNAQFAPDAMLPISPPLPRSVSPLLRWLPWLSQAWPMALFGSSSQALRADSPARSLTVLCIHPCHCELKVLVPADRPARVFSEISSASIVHSLALFQILFYVSDSPTTGMLSWARLGYL